VPTFVPGLELAEGFFREHVEPILARSFPRLRYSAGLIGAGSEVLGFDTEMSSDHHWGPRAMLFLEEADLVEAGAAIHDELARSLPPRFRGYSTHFSAPNPLDHGVQSLVEHTIGPINHRVELNTLERFFYDYLGLGAGEPLSPADWLSLPSQKLRTIVAGRVFRDDLGLQVLRDRLRFYPDEVAWFVLGSLWLRIGQEEHLMGRAAHAGDDLGSRIIAARLARDAMRVLFCLRREYPPYAKWLGTAFARLSGADVLAPKLRAALAAESIEQREAALCSAFEVLVSLQREEGLPIGIDGQATQFWGRPFRVIQGERIADAVFECITDPRLSMLAKERRIGSIDLVSDNTDLLEDAELRTRVRALFEA
jgi:hypothetical protein